MQKMFYKCEYFITLCLYHKAAYKVLSTVKKMEGMRATRRRRSTLKSHLLRWAPAAPVVAIPKVPDGHGANHLSASSETFVFVPAVCCQEQSVQPRVSEEFLMISDAYSFVGCKTSHGIAYRLRVSPLPLWSHVNLLSESNFSKTSFLSESIDDGGTYLNDSSTNLKVLDLVLKQQ